MAQPLPCACRAASGACTAVWATRRRRRVRMGGRAQLRSLLGAAVALAAARACCWAPALCAALQPLFVRSTSWAGCPPARLAARFCNLPSGRACSSACSPSHPTGGQDAHPRAGDAGGPAPDAGAAPWWVAGHPGAPRPGAIGAAPGSAACRLPALTLQRVHPLHWGCPPAVVAAGDRVPGVALSHGLDAPTFLCGHLDLRCVAAAGHRCAAVCTAGRWPPGLVTACGMAGGIALHRLPIRRCPAVCHPTCCLAPACHPLHLPRGAATAAPRPQRS